MQFLLCILSLSLLLIAPIGSAQEQPPTDAQRDGFAGPIKSVSTTIVTTPGVKWQPPGGPTMVMPILCRDCEYDPDGTKTTSGQFADGKFWGEIISLRRGADGLVTDRVITSTFTGEVVSHQVLGPFGKTAETMYMNGKEYCQQTFSYDQYGHMTEWLSLDSAGEQQSLLLATTTKDGIATEKAVWGKKGELQWRKTFDPETGEQRFTYFDGYGNLKLTWRFANGKVLSFWEPSDSPRQFGESFSQSKGNGDVDLYQCHDVGLCDRSRVHYEYLDPPKRNPTSAEWRDSDGNLLFAAYYEYEIDSFRNWTHRRVSVWESDQDKRTLYEEDSRTIDYWQK
jgi:hypothetical protein